jgi:hypothetical protein
MPLFQQSVIKKHLESFDKKHIEERWQLFRGIFHSAEKQQNIRNSKEEQYQEGFLRDLFVTVLGYTINPEVNFNLLTEQKNVNNSKKADGAILMTGSNGMPSIVAVIELKGTETTDLNKIEIQAFGYKNNQPGCNYVITSNFEKLRFYIDNTTQQEEFNLFTLTKAQFELLYACLAWESISKNTPMQILNESVSKENIITKSLYKDYSEFKRALFANLVEMNPQYDKLVLFKKTQKLLDRFLFIFFAEDRLLLPTNLIFRINKEWENIIAQRIQVSLYDRYKMYFNDLNIGAKVTLPAFGKKTGEAITAEFEIFAYNGGLFQPDDLLDNIQIEDTLLHSYTQKMSHYNFESDVDVNILGHIFENSLNEIDEIKSEIEGNVLEKTKTRRKKDGVFYTPKYITKYIVDNTIGKLCTEKKEEIKLMDEDFTSTHSTGSGSAKSGHSKTKKKALLDKLTDYRNWLLDLTICDPACGSGAFLNQVLEFLIAEHRYVDELQAKLLGDSLILSDIENSILERNIYGVDLNDESVEIAKLSLWLRTAQKGRKLNSLNNNIKCGNSLIDDPAVAGDKAFSWEKEFPEVFAKGGFDVVIGNPPYVRVENKVDYSYLSSNYKTASNRIDLYSIFIEKSLEILKEKSKVSFIVPNTFVVNLQYDKLRRMLFDHNFHTIIDFRHQVFEDVTVDVAIFILDKSVPFSELNVYKSIAPADILNNAKPFSILNHSSILKNGFVINLNSNDLEFRTLDRIKENKHVLSDLCKIRNGINPGMPESRKHLLIDSPTEGKNPVKRLDGKDIYRWGLNWENKWIDYDKTFKVDGGSLRDETLFTSPKILVQDIRNLSLKRRIIATYDDKNYYNLYTLHNIIPLSDEIDIKYILAILNSTLMNFYFASNYKDIHIKPRYLSDLPICKINLESQKVFIDKAQFMLSLNEEFYGFQQKFSTYFSSQYKLDKLPGKLEKWYDLEFVDFIKELNKAIKGVKGTPLTKKDEFEWMDLFEENKKKALELKAEIDKTDKEIDRMVYELYGLNEEEIKIVEGE